MVKLCWLPSIGSVFRLEASLRPCASSIGKRTMVAVVTVTTRTMTTLIPEMIAGICGQSFNHCSLQHRIYLNYNRYNINHPNFLTCIFEPPVLVCSGCIHSVKLINVLQHLPFTPFISATSDTFRYCVFKVSRHFSCAVILALSLRSLSATSFDSSVMVIKIIDVSDPFVAPVAPANWEANLRRLSQLSHLWQSMFSHILRVSARPVRVLHHVATTVLHHVSSWSWINQTFALPVVCVCAGFILCKYSIDLDGSYTYISSKDKGWPTHTLTSLITHNSQWSDGTHRLCHIERKNASK